MKSFIQGKRLPLSVSLVAVALVLLAPTSFIKANSVVFDKVLPSTGFILVPLGNGTENVGTCWVVDHERRLVITNNHVVTDKKEAIVFFPMFNDGDVIPLRDHHIKNGERFAGKVIYRDVSRDLALVQLDKLPANAKALTLATKSARPGDTVHSIGNSGQSDGVLWRYTRGQVRSVAPYNLKYLTGMLRARVVETQSPINPGDSGGPLVNERGELIGVVSGFQSQDRLVTYNIDVNEVRTFLADASRVESPEAVSVR